VVCRLSGGRVEADPGLVGQGGDPPGPQHRREGAQHAWQAPCVHHWHTLWHTLNDDLAPRDLGAVDGHDRHHRTPGSGRIWAAWSASNDTARKIGASG
jgi:hypothetical protein